MPWFLRLLAHVFEELKKRTAERDDAVALYEVRLRPCTWCLTPLPVTARFFCGSKYCKLPASPSELDLLKPLLILPSLQVCLTLARRPGCCLTCSVPPHQRLQSSNAAPGYALSMQSRHNLLLHVG